MNLKTKNYITAVALGLIALSFYFYALPPTVIEQLAKALKSAFNG